MQQGPKNKSPLHKLSTLSFQFAKININYSFKTFSCRELIISIDNFIYQIVSMCRGSLVGKVMPVSLEIWPPQKFPVDRFPE